MPSSMQNFDTHLIESEESESTTKSSQSFDSILYNSISFTATVVDFQESLTWFARIQQSITMQIRNIKQSIKFTAHINIGTLKLEFTTTLARLSGNFYATISQTIKMESKIKMLKKMGDVLLTIPIKFECRLRDLITGGNVILLNSNIKIEAIPTCRKYALLNFYDAYLLSDWDSSLLQDMDFTIV
jgi:hypothetical protein